MKNKIFQLGKLVGEIEKVSSTNFCKFLLQKFTGRFFTNQDDFVKAYLTINEKAIQLELQPVIITGEDVDSFEYNTETRNGIKFEFWKGYNEFHVLNTRKKIGEKIRELRIMQGLKQSDLAEMTGLKQQNIGRIELGKYSTGLDILTKISAALNLEISVIRDSD